MSKTGNSTVDLWKAVFVEGQRAEVLLRGTTIKARVWADDVWYHGARDALTGRVVATTPGFPEALRVRIEEKFAPDLIGAP